MTKIHAKIAITKMSNYFSTISEKKKPLFSLIRIYSTISFFDEIISTVFEIHEESSTVYSVFISESSVSKDVKCFFEKKNTHTHWKEVVL